MLPKKKKPFARVHVSFVCLFVSSGFFFLFVVFFFFSPGPAGRVPLGNPVAARQECRAGVVSIVMRRAMKCSNQRERKIDTSRIRTPCFEKAPMEDPNQIRRGVNAMPPHPSSNSLIPKERKKKKTGPSGVQVIHRRKSREDTRVPRDMGSGREEEEK